MQVRNTGGMLFTPFTVDLYVDWAPTVCEEWGDYSTEIQTIGPGETIEVEFEMAGLAADIYEINGYVDTRCVVNEISDPADPTPEDNEYGPDTLEVVLPTIFFGDDFETGDFSQWTRFNDGDGWLYPCAEAAVSGGWGACVERGDNDKRKQLIDETPVNQTNFNVRFNFDINSLSMQAEERFRFMQVKMGAERPFFIVLLYRNGQYKIQLNTLLDDQTKVKTGWYVLSDEPHTVEVDWRAASADGSNNGWIRLYLDGTMLEVLSGLDNDTLYVENFKVGFTSRLAGKSISGMIYIDDVATSNTGYLGVP
jgi:hypothetical protein